MPPSRDDFYAAPKLGWFALIIVPLVVAAALHGALSVYLAIWLVAFALFITFVPVLTVDSDGIRMSRFFRLRWDQVRDARVRRYLDQAYLAVHRTRGRRWSIPLYYTNGRSAAEAILVHAPAGGIL